jgi:glycosyltransferase involved in cell wall biosynthesis
MKTKRPLVCICIPNYNNEKTIAKTLDSLITQTYDNIIIKVFDNASTDSSFKIILEYESKYKNIHAYQNAKNIGAEANFTKCIENMEGDYSAIYHSDDIYMPTIVEEEVEFLMRSNDLGAVFTRKKRLARNGIFKDENFPLEFLKEDYYEFSFFEIFQFILKYGNFINTPSVMAITSLYKNYIVNWDSGRFATSSDLDVWLRFSQIKKIGMISKELLLYRYDNSSFSYRRKFSNYNQADFITVLEYYVDKNSLSDRRLLKYQLLKDEMRILRNKLLNGMRLDSNALKLFDLDFFILMIKGVVPVKFFMLAIMYKISSVRFLSYFSGKILKYRYKSEA